MEWVVALLALGCLVFILHMVSDYYKRRQELEPKIQRLDEAKGKLQQEITSTRGVLEEQRGQLYPLREQVTNLEQESRHLQQQVPAKKPRTKPGGADPAPKKDPA
ncbi:MAG: hypothetical protein IT369_03915 [Candidatus Latescibacteria bacterium]|nr:hypothetical protein [Candidatus Latescibacterota bacterium]